MGRILPKRMRTSNPNYGISKKLHACTAHTVFTSNHGISKKSHACTAHKVIVQNGSDPIDNSDFLWHEQKTSRSYHTTAGTVHKHHPSTRLPKRQNETLSGASEKEAQVCQVGSYPQRWSTCMGRKAGKGKPAGQRPALETKMADTRIIGKTQHISRQCIFFLLT